MVLILNINSNSKQCIGIEGCVNLSKRIILKEIDVKHVLTGRLYMDDKSIDPDCFGKEYLKKIFALCDRRDSYPIEFYKWIVEKSCCEEERPKGYVGRNDKF